jgi:hypothetical protein
MSGDNLDGLEDNGQDAISLFEVPAEYGPPWQFDLSTVEIEQTSLLDEDGDPVYGITHQDARRVIINAAYPVWLQEMVMMHELLHTRLDCHGIDWLTPEREEMIVTYLAPRLYSALQAVGFKWPKRDKACADMCRQAVIDST